MLPVLLIVKGRTPFATAFIVVRTELFEVVASIRLLLKRLAKKTNESSPLSTVLWGPVPEVRMVATTLPLDGFICTHVPFPASSPWGKYILVPSLLIAALSTPKL